MLLKSYFWLFSNLAVLLNFPSGINKVLIYLSICLSCLPSLSFSHSPLHGIPSFALPWLSKMHWTWTSFSVPLAVDGNGEAWQATVIIFPFAQYQLFQQPLCHSDPAIVSMITISSCLISIMLSDRDWSHWERDCKAFSHQYWILVANLLANNIVNRSNIFYGPILITLVSQHTLPFKSLVSERFFFFLRNSTFIQQGCAKLIKVDSEDFLCYKKYIWNECCFFNYDLQRKKNNILIYFIILHKKKKSFLICNRAHGKCKYCMQICRN